MMNFLDLSAASEDERRVIKEILADTSVVNFAEPLRQQFQQQQQYQQQYQNLANNKQLQHQQPHTIKAKFQFEQHKYVTDQVSSNGTSQKTSVHYSAAPTEQDDQHQRHHHQVPQPVLSTTNATSNIEPPSTNSAQSSLASIKNLGATTNHAEHNMYNTSSSNIGSDYHTNHTNKVSAIKSHAYQMAVTHANAHLALPANIQCKSAATAISTNSTNGNITTSNATPSSSTVPPQTIANQMPPQMGDINSVIGMDMAPSQPQGYAITGPPTHVPAFGPPPLPTHVYGGPPIFQPHYAHYLIPTNYPNLAYYVLPTTNSVASPRQQNAPQSNQNSVIPNNTQTRPHSHHQRPNKLKDLPKQHHQHHAHQYHQQLQHTQQFQQEFRSNAHIESHVYKNGGIPVNEETHLKLEKTEQQPAVESLDNQILKTNNNPKRQREPQKSEDGNCTKISNGVEDIVKTSPDDSFETRSDAPKLPHNTNNALVDDRSESPKGECSSENIKSSHDISELDSNEQSHSNQDTRAAGLLGSASCKSWASLFKADVTTYHTTSVDGDTDHNELTTESSNRDDALRTNQKAFINSEISQISSNAIVSTKEQRSQDAARRALDKLAPKLAQKINSISLKHSLPLLRPRGFINKGNGCYINSTLQALIACPPFYNLMKEIGDLRGLKRDNSCTPILDSFAELFQNFPPLDASKKNKQQLSSPVDIKMQMNYLQADAIEPKCIYNVLGQIKSECLRGAQEDAEEFLSSVLNGLHEEMIGLSEALQSSQSNMNNHNGHLSDADDVNADSNNDDNLWREVGPKNRSLPIRAATVINTPIQEIFGGSLFSIRTAGKDRCGHRSPFFDLQLDISDAIKSFTATETIQDFYCSKTKQKLDAQRRTSLDQLPPILILHLKQFIYSQDHGLKKLMNRIEYPIDFELPEGCLHDKNSDKSLKNSRSYKLLAVVYHEGKEAVKGHYLTDVYHIGSSQWIRCDDSNLKVVPAPRIENPDSSRTPYLLFYRRLNTLGPRQSNSHDNKKKS